MKKYTKIVLKTLKEKIWYFSDEKELLERYTKLIIDRFQYEFRTNKISELSDLLKICEELDLDVKQAYSNLHETIRIHKLDFEEHKIEISRFEKEVILLKDLIQEKNLVIDKLLADKNKENSNNE